MEFLVTGGPALHGHVHRQPRWQLGLWLKSIQARGPPLLVSRRVATGVTTASQESFYLFRISHDVGWVEEEDVQAPSQLRRECGSQVSPVGLNVNLIATTRFPRYLERIRIDVCCTTVRARGLGSRTCGHDLFQKKNMLTKCG